MHNFLHNFLRLLKLELRMFSYNRAAIIQEPMTFLLLLLIFPIALGDNLHILNQAIISAIWMATVFSILLNIKNIFMDDYNNGILDQIIAKSWLLYPYIAAKIMVYWLKYLIALIFILIIINLLFINNSIEVLSLGLSLAISSLCFILIGCFINMLLITIKNKGYLLILLLIPLYIPIIIFGSLGNFALLAAMLFFLLGCVPFLVRQVICNAIF